MISLDYRTYLNLTKGRDAHVVVNNVLACDETRAYEDEIRRFNRYDIRVAVHRVTCLKCAETIASWAQIPVQATLL